ncbi:MAG: thioesterase family protein [Bacteroidota bacterium]
MYQHITQIRVRYGETDQMGYVYYGNYSSYYEVARVEALRHLGMSYRELEDVGIMMPVLENHSYYHQPVYYDDLLSIQVTLAQMPSVKITFDYEFRTSEDKLVHSGKTVLAFMKADTKRACRPPQAMIKLLEPYFT